MKIPYINNDFFARLETSALNVKNSLGGYFGGKHLVKTYGQTVEFADFREYMLGDDIRRIDWNLYSRFEKYFLKLFTDERQMHTRIFLDCSASMAKPEPSKAQYAMAFTAALGFLTVHNMDKLTLRLMQGDRANNPYGTIVGNNSFFGMVGDMEHIVFDGETDIEKAIIGCGDDGTSDGITVIVSDFFTDSNWKKAVDYLSYKKRHVVLVQVLTPEDIDPTYTGRVTLIDSESEDITDEKNMKIRITRGAQEAYQRALKDFLQDISTFCRSREADFITVTTDTPIEKAVFGQLINTGIME